MVIIMVKIQNPKSKQNTKSKQSLLFTFGVLNFSYYSGKDISYFLNFLKNVYHSVFRFANSVVLSSNFLHLCFLFYLSLFKISKSHSTFTNYIIFI